MAFSLLGYFLSMITALTAVVAVMIGLFDTSTSERTGHYSHPRVVERNEPRLFMVVPETKNGTPIKDKTHAKNIVEANSAAVEANSVAVPAEQPGAVKLHKPKVLARMRNNYERPRYYGNALSYAERSGYRPGLDAQR